MSAHAALASRARIGAVALGVLALLTLPLDGNVSEAVPTTFTVNSSLDAPDALASDGVCDTVPGPPVICTLRAAIEESNALNGPNVINFTATNTVLGSNLPTITERLTIDASANPAGFSIDATGATDGLTLGVGSSGSVIRGLNIFDAPGDGLAIIGGASHTIGGDPSAGAAPTGEGNAFHGNGSDGIDIRAGSQGGHTIIGNRIGTAPDGLSPDGNTVHGINISGGTGADITIGGFPNLISANGVDGVYLAGGSPNVTIQHNWIGLDANGSASDPFANAIAGIHLDIDDSTVLNNRIAGGGVVPAGNPGDEGILLHSDDNTLLGNCIGFDSDCDGTAGGFGFEGIECIGGDRNIIGDGTDDGRNVIGNTNFEGILLGTVGAATECDDNDINGNYVGFGGDGEEGAVINDDCIEIEGDSNQIRNNFVGNCNLEGIDVDVGVSNVIDGNDIGRGTNPATADDINEFCIELSGTGSNQVINNVMANCNADAPDATIQITSGSFNVIQGNDITSPVGEDAIDIEAGVGNLVAGDTFRMVNQWIGDLPIDLIGAEGVNLNDAGDVDAGTNLLHNYPVFPPTSPTVGCARGNAGPFDEVRIYTKSTAAGVTTYELAGSGFANVLGDFTVCINNVDKVTVVGTATTTAASTTDLAAINSTSEFSITEQVVAAGATPTSTATPTHTHTPTSTLTLPGDNITGNDDFANAWEITAFPFTGAQNTEGMTTEVGEPLSPETSSTDPSDCILAVPNEMGGTVWYQFTPSKPGVVIAETDDSNFDTVLAVYTGEAVDALTVVICNDDTFGLQSEVTFEVTAGTAYYLQVGGFSTNRGDMKLRVSSTPGDVLQAPTATATLTATATPTKTATATPTQTLTSTPTPTITQTATSTSTSTATSTPTSTNTPTVTPTGTIPTATPTGSSTPTSTPTLTHTPSATASVSPTVTPTSTAIPPAFVTPTPTPTLFSEVSPTVVPPGNVLGDVNCDGVVDSIDAVFVLWFKAGLGILPCAKNADANQDGLINSLDALVILQFHAFLLPGLPPPQFAGETWAEQLSSWLAGLW